jgi:CHASE2 domain-containing sensor protein
MLFAGALADGGTESWPGLLGGALCALLGWRAVGGLIERARTRLEGGAAALLTAYADAIALLLAAIAIFLPPASLLAIAAFVFLLVSGGRREGEKYAGLRILR